MCGPGRLNVPGAHRAASRSNTWLRSSEETSTKSGANSRISACSTGLRRGKFFDAADLNSILRGLGVCHRIAALTTRQVCPLAARCRSHTRLLRVDPPRGGA